MKIDELDDKIKALEDLAVSLRALRGEEYLKTPKEEKPREPKKGEVWEMSQSRTDNSLLWVCVDSYYSDHKLFFVSLDDSTEWGASHQIKPTIEHCKEHHIKFYAENLDDYFALKSVTAMEA